MKRIGGKPTRLKLGTTSQLSVEAARTAAAALAGEVATGKNPQRERDQPTIGELFEYWLKHAKTHKRTWQEDERLYNAYIKPWDNRRLADIARRHVELWHARIGEKKERTDGKKGRMLGGPYVANRVLGLLRAAYEKADRIGYCGSNPATGVKKFPEEQRDRFLTGDDLRAFFASLAQEPVLYQDFFMVSLLTGARRGNVQAMRWEDLNLINGLWRIPGNVSKNGQVILIPLIPAAAGASMVVIGKSLGHRPGSPATAVYARLELDPVRASVQTAATAMLTAGGQHHLLNIETKEDENDE